MEEKTSFEVECFLKIKCPGIIRNNFFSLRIKTMQVKFFLHVESMLFCREKDSMIKESVFSNYNVIIVKNDTVFNKISL